MKAEDIDMKIEGIKDVDKLVIPIYPEWIEYKGEVFVSQLNFEATAKARKPMFDLSYCMTRALNDCILHTVQYDKNKFKRTTKAN
jgi:NAD-dependent DNA ligase